MQEPVQEPIPAPVVQVSKPDCASQLSKYDWPQDQAYKVMFQESSNNPDTLNNNPDTGDYSVGCFQINIIGENAKNRPSEAELKNPEINVEFAYNLWVSQGRSFCTTGGWYNTCRKVL